MKKKNEKVSPKTFTITAADDKYIQKMAMRIARNKKKLPSASEGLRIIIQRSQALDSYIDASNSKNFLDYDYLKNFKLNR